MGNERGFTVLELVVVAGLIGIVAAIAIPSMNNALERNRVFTSADLVGAQIRSARLAAISRNAAFRVRFDCPATGAIRVLAVTGDATIDNAANRCTTNVANDGPPIYMPQGITFGTVPTLEINGRGLVSAIGGTMPLSIAVSHESNSRTLVVSAIGRVSTPGS